MAARMLVALGNFRAERRATVETAAQQAGFSLDCVEKADEALNRLKEPPAAVLLDMMTPGAERVCHAVRGAEALFGVPVIAITRKITDLSFSNAYRWGADDVLTLNAPEPLSARLQTLVAPKLPDGVSGRGQAVIADTDTSRAQILSRVLTAAGFTVRHAKDLTAARFYLTRSEARLVVFSTEIGNAKQIISEAQVQEQRPNLIILCRPTELEHTSAQLKDLPGVATLATSHPPENILYLANELEESRDADARNEARALYGTVVAFRPAGDDADDFGFSYNVSASGLYVRTLAPCTANEVWVELRPPRSSRRIRLVCSVVWRRSYGLTGKETAPPGFGLQVRDAVTADLEAWEQGFEHAIADHRRSFSIPPRVSQAPQATQPSKPTKVEASQRPTRPHTVEEVIGDEEVLSVLPEPKVKKPAAPVAPTRAAKAPASAANPGAPGTGPHVKNAEVLGARALNTAVMIEHAETLPPSVLESLPAAKHGVQPVANGLLAGRKASDPLTPVAYPPPPPVLAQVPRATPAEAVAAKRVAAPTQPATDTALLAAAPSLLEPATASDPNRPTQIATATEAAGDATRAHSTPAPQPALSSRQEHAFCQGEAEGDGAPLHAARPLAAAIRPALLDFDEGGLSPSQLPGAPDRITKKSGAVAIAVGILLGMVLAWVYYGATQPVERKREAIMAAPASPAPLKSATISSAANVPRNEPAESTPLPKPALQGSASEEPETQSVAVKPELNAEPVRQPVAPPPDAHGLPAKLGYLYVESPISAQVYVHGQLAGATNQWLRASCGTRFIRLGRGAGDWLSKGSVVILKCRTTNKISIAEGR